MTKKKKKKKKKDDLYSGEKEVNTNCFWVTLMLDLADKGLKAVSVT